MGESEAIRLLAEVGIDIEDLKRRIASGEWMIVEGDAECVVNTVAVTRHAAILLVAGETTVCLARKTRAFREATGITEELARRIIWIHTSRVPTGCAATVWTEESAERVAEEIARALIGVAEKVAGLEKRGRDPGYTT